MTFENVYEMITPPNVLKKSWFVDYFDGDAARAWWTTNSATPIMDDAIDGGLKWNDTGNQWITFNNIRHYDDSASVFVAILKSNDLTVSQLAAGGTFDAASMAADLVLVGERTSSDANFMILSVNGGNSTTGSSIAIDTNFHKHQATLQASTALYHLDGILEATHTTNLPNAGRLQPVWFAQNNIGGAIRYFEAYNT